MNETDATWVRIISWHIRSGVVSRGGMIKALCGRWADPHAPQADERPQGKTCETCLP
jgi:hypothetical protein